MKLGATRSGEHPGNSSPRRGAALLIVLSLLALILLLALMTLRTGGRHAGTQGLMTDSMEVDALTSLPVNIVLSQIQAGTVETSPDTVWTSQPGMIRTFGSDQQGKENSPQPLMHYRLYSAPVMCSPVLDVAGEAAVIEGWQGKPSAFTDLNEPIFSYREGSGELHYPIADPARIGVTDGFSLNPAAPGATLRQPLPLPVAWIYVLRDGQLVMPVSSDGKSAVFEKSKVGRNNPIVARVAFWTDDESSKLNMNTATEPDPWDSPAANTLTERHYAENPPVMAEAYRISTHPAYTGLSPVLRHFGEGKPGIIQWPPDPSATNDSSREKYFQFYQSLVPDGVMAVADGPVTNKRQRLFPSLEEFYYDPDRLPNGLAGGFRMSRRDLGRSRFLLTTHSSAPELNPRGHPKIALWMMPANRNDRSGEDRRMNTCSMLPGGQEFIFQRAGNWLSPARPGSSQSMIADWDEVPRNQQLYAWLQALTEKPFPGYSGSFEGKYGRRSRDQILTSMLDMLRWSTNPGPYLPPPSGAANPQGTGSNSAVPLTINNADGTAWTRGFGIFPTTTEVAIVFAFTDVARGSNGLPRDSNHDGICDRATKLKAFIVMKPFIAAAGSRAASPAFSLRIRRLQHFTIGEGIGLLLPGGNSRNRCTFAGSALPDRRAGPDFTCFASQFLQADGQPKEPGNREDPALGFPFISSENVRLPEESGEPGGSIRFSGGAVIVDFMEPNAPPASPRPNDAIHSVEMEFPPCVIPFPPLAVDDFVKGPRSLASRFALASTPGQTQLPVIRQGDVVRSMILNPNGPSAGDVRLLAAQREALFANDEANRALFIPHPGYDSPSVMLAHSLPDAAVDSDPSKGPDASVNPPGTLLRGVMYARNASPAVTSGLDGAVITAVGMDPGGRPGDWETGSGALPDGPFLNRSANQSMADLIPDQPYSELSPQSTLPFPAVRFGAIPSGLFGDVTNPAPRPWQTLLFCPNPTGRTTPADFPGRYDDRAHDHFGFASPPDYLWLEYFWNPVVSPRPLSADFATEGKVNLNFQILPWIWLRRSTALHGALEGIRMTAIPTRSMTGENGSAKGTPDGSPVSRQFRYAVDAARTLTAFEKRFDAGRVFLYASEICSIFLVPKRLSGSTYDGPDNSPANPDHADPAKLSTWWNGFPEDPADAFEATGDNLRESAYAQLYSRICTQSNIFRVHYRVQLLKKVPFSPPATWQENRDVMVCERRGSYVIERRFDPGESMVADPATHPDAPSLHTRTRLVISAHEPFTP